MNALQSVLRTINAIPNVPVPSSWLRKLSSSGHDFESTFLRFAKGKSDSKRYPNICETPGLGINLWVIFKMLISTGKTIFEHLSLKGQTN